MYIYFIRAHLCIIEIVYVYKRYIFVSCLFENKLVCENKHNHSQELESKNSAIIIVIKNRKN